MSVLGKVAAGGLAALGGGALSYWVFGDDSGKV